MTFTGSGFTPGGAVPFTLQLKGDNGSNILFGANPEIADASGAFTSVYPAPKLASSDDVTEDLFTIATDQTVIDATGPTDASFALAQTTLSTFDVFVPPWDNKRVDPRKKVTVTALGYEPATQLWAFYVRGSKTVKRVFVGKLTAPCGDLTVRMREFPFRPVPAGDYAVYFQGSKTLDRSLGTPYKHVRVPRSKAVH
jgi:hypothetical protein